MAETRKVAAILAADVVGYSKLAGSDEERSRQHAHYGRAANGKPAAAVDASARDLAFAVFPGCHPARRQLEDTDPAAGVTYVAAAVSDLEDFEAEAFSLTLARESVPAAKFLIVGEPAAYRGFGRHRGISADGPEAFAVDEPGASGLPDPRAGGSDR